MEIAKQGDLIEWTIDKDSPSDLFAGKTFKAKVAIVLEKEKQYGVYAEYGQDYVSFKDATIIKTK